ncbi:MAG: PTH2 family peptidyl-tRNA hydrolase [Myxococcota bacterium]
MSRAIGSGALAGVMLDPYLGAWVLDPAASDPGDAPAPVRAVYCLMPADGGVWAHAQWTEASGERQVMTFTTPLDGTPRSHPSGVELAGRLDATGLYTQATHEGAVVLEAHRTVSPDGGTLTVVQRTDGVRTTGVYRRSRVKQVICYRRDLKMRKGKIAAQCAHASIGVFTRRDQGPPDHLVVPLDGPSAVWLRRGSAKVVLSVETEADLLAVHAAAGAAGLPCSLITDAGRTEFGGVPTRTAVAIGPGVVSEIDAITGPEGLVATKLA